MTSADVNTSVLEQLDFDVAIPCEATGHGVPYSAPTRDINGKIWRPVGHEGGAAEWRMSCVCPMCADASTKLVCDVRRRRVMSSISIGRTTICASCGVITPTRDWGYRFTPLFGDEK